jgi:hypothetical protein
MEATMKSKGFAVGSTVAINADLTWCWGAAANVIAEVKDVRLLGRAYVYTLASIVEGATIATDVPADELHAVRC